MAVVQQAGEEGAAACLRMTTLYASGLLVACVTLPCCLLLQPYYPVFRLAGFTSFDGDFK